MNKKFKKGLLKEILKEQKEEEYQRELKEKHNIKKDNVVIVEKNNMVKFLIMISLKIIKSMSTVLLLILAALGLLSLLYPEIREPLIVVLTNLWEELMSLLPL